MRGDVRPPLWADALLRTCLSPPEAETESGDLLEAYRDSIYPARGRWRADLWYVRQVVGYVLRAKGMGLRNWLLAGLALCVLTIAFSLFMYPALFVLAGATALTWPVVAVGLLLYGYAAACHTLPATPEDATVLRLGVRYGIAVAVLPFIGRMSISVVGWFAVPAIFSIFFIPFVAGAHAGIKLWRVRAAMLVGFWSGLISGLILFLVLMAFGYLPAGAEVSQSHRYAAVEYQQIKVGDNLAVGLWVLIYGGAFSVVGATLAGLAGIALARTGRSPEEPRRISW